MERAVVEGLGATHEILGVDHRLAGRHAFAVEHNRTTASIGRQLATQAAHRDRHNRRRHREGIRCAVARRHRHEASPERHRQVARVAVGDDRPRHVVPDPDARDEVRREADEPRVVIVIRGSRLAGSRQRETDFACLPRGPRVDDVGHHRRHDVRGRFAERALLVRGCRVQDMP